MTLHVYYVIVYTTPISPTQPSSMCKIVLCHLPIHIPTLSTDYLYHRFYSNTRSCTNIKYQNTTAGLLYFMEFRLFVVVGMSVVMCVWVVFVVVMSVWVVFVVMWVMSVL